MEIIITRRDRANLIVDCDIRFGRPANRYGHPDTWSPAEPDEVEIYSIEMERGDRIRRLPKKLEQYLKDSDWLLDKLIEEAENG